MFVVLSVLLAIACLVPAAAKLLGHPRMQESARHFGIRWRRYRLIGVAELAAAAGMTALLAGALITHRRAGDSGKEVAPAMLTLIISVAYLVTALAG